jgi:predicted ATPase/DNA-binding CsgD family transcriptional regulator
MTDPECEMNVPDALESATPAEERASDTTVIRLPARGREQRLIDSRALMLGEHSNNLPAPFSSFVGRERQIEELRRLLEAHRLVTLAGAPGVGKTRLAVQLANQLRTDYADGVWMVELAYVEQPALAASATARALGVREASRTPIEALMQELRDRELLLVLDNCEHVLDACAALTEALLTSCPGVRVLATSRQALGLTGEIAWRVPSLSVPAPPASASRTGRDTRSLAARRSDATALRTLLASEAGRLFVERARAARASFELTEADTAAVEEICQRVDGIPLAIELAAARIAHLAPRQIADRLDDRFRLLARGRSSTMPRHDTLRSLVDWSHDLLSDAERRVFRRMSVFVGGWTLEAAEAVVGEGFWGLGVGGTETGRPSPNTQNLTPNTLDTPTTLDLLGRLVDKSLVVVDEQPAALRYTLHETIRHYALERLAESGEAPEVRRLHAEYYLMLAEDVQPRLFGAELQPLLEVLEREHDNLRLALRWSSEVGEGDVGPRLAGALWRFWQVRGYLPEGRAWLERLLPTLRTAEPTSGRARALNAIGFLAFLQGDYDTGQPLLAESVEIRRALGDRPGLVESLTNLGVLLRCVGNGAGARRCFEEAIAVSRALGDRAWEGRTLNKLARLTYYEGDLGAALALHEEGIAAVRQAGNAWDVAIALGDMADVCHALGDDTVARRLYAESLGLWLELGDERGIAQGLEGFAIQAAAAARPERAVRLIGTAHAIRERITEPNSPSRRASLERLLAAAQTDLGAAAYATAWAAGNAASPAEAVALALADHDLPLSAAPDPASTSTAAAASAALTGREREIVVRVLRGLTNRGIAAELVISERTVEWHVSNILKRLGLRSRAQLALWAREHGISPTE